MAGRQWHWIAAGMAAVAVFVAVLLNDTTSSSIVRGHPFASVDYTPEVGSPVLATPTVDATTVTKATPQAQVQRPPVKQTPSAAPPPSTATPEPEPPAKPPNVTLSLTLPELELPVFFPDCDTAWFFGAAPIEKGEPGYRKELDRDRDGVACESR